MRDRGAQLLSRFIPDCAGFGVVLKENGGASVCVFYVDAASQEGYDAARCHIYIKKITLKRALLRIPVGSGSVGDQ